jgi:PAS domain S-box-containing protein
MKARLDKVENMLRSICSDTVDPVVLDSLVGEPCFIREGVEQPSREMLKSTSEALVAVMPDGDILYCNERFAEITKANLQTIIGSNLLAYCSNENRAEILTAFQKSYASASSIRATLLASDATLVPVSMTMRGQCSHGTDIIAIVMTDLTKWQQGERDIRALRMINACSNVIIHATDEAGMLTDVCRVLVDIGGYKFAWVGYTGDVPAESFCPVARAAKNNDCCNNLGIVSTAEIEAGDGSCDTAICSRHVFTARDIYLQLDTEPRGCLLRGADYRPRMTVPLLTDNKCFGCCVVCPDESHAFDREELKLLTTLANDLAFGLAAQRNKTACSQLAAIVHSAGDAIYRRDLNGTITSWNKAGELLFGYCPGEIIGQPIAILCPQERTEESQWLFEKVQRGELVEQFDTIQVAKDGRRIHVSLTYSPIRDDTGCIVAAAIILRDNTARKNAEKALRLEEEQRDILTRNLAKARDTAELANQAKSRFLAGITHELRTPLHGILGYAELLCLEGGLNPTQLERLNAMMNAGHHLLETINAVLDMSQIEADQLELHPVEIELTDLIRTCLDVVRPKAEAKRLALIMAPTMPLRLFADPVRVRQMLLNLLSNAVKFTPAGAVEIRLQQAEAGDCIRLTVADTGPGIWVKHRDKMFNAFERLNAEAVSGIEGSGLGLAITARLVKLMGGRIGYADNPGGGSVFWVELPYGTVPMAESVAASLSPLAERPRLRVLVVDDEAMNRSIASVFLSRVGHDVVCVDTGAAAVDAAATVDFDVVLMDVRMPGMNGLEATRLIRALPGPRGEVRVIAVTAQAFAQQIAACRQAGMDGHVSKPFKQAELLAALENVTKTSTDTERAVVPPTVALADTGTEFPILDRGAFNDITVILSAADLETNLQLLITRCEEVLCGLRMPGMLSRIGNLAEAAHKLAGGAGMFGFLHVAAVARQFEAAADMGAPETEALGNHLAAAIEASVTLLRQESSAMTSSGK